MVRSKDQSAGITLRVREESREGKEGRRGEERKSLFPVFAGGGRERKKKGSLLPSSAPTEPLGQAGSLSFVCLSVSV